MKLWQNLNHYLLILWKPGEYIVRCCLEHLTIYWCVMAETCKKLLLWEEHIGVCYLLKQNLRMDGCCCLVTKLCTTLSQPVDCSLSGSSVHGISQARILEWVPFPSPGDLPVAGIEPIFLAPFVSFIGRGILYHKWSKLNRINIRILNPLIYIKFVS